MVQMSVIGASENRFTHGGLTETHLQQLPDPSDYDHASAPLTMMKGLNVSILMAWHLNVAYVGNSNQGLVGGDETRKCMKSVETPNSETVV